MEQSEQMYVEIHREPLVYANLSRIEAVEVGLSCPCASVPSLISLVYILMTSPT